MNNSIYLRFLMTTFLLFFFFSNSSVAEDSGSFKRAGDWLVVAKIANLNPSVKSKVSIGGFVDADFDTFPLLDLRYFLSDHLAIEAIVGTTKHEVGVRGTELGDVNLGSIKVLPPTITVQYHFDTGTNFLPYIGVGLN